MQGKTNTVNAGELFSAMVNMSKNISGFVLKAELAGQVKELVEAAKRGEVISTTEIFHLGKSLQNLYVKFFASRLYWAENTHLKLEADGIDNDLIDYFKKRASTFVENAKFHPTDLELSAKGYNDMLTAFEHVNATQKTRNDARRQKAREEILSESVLRQQKREEKYSRKVARRNQGSDDTWTLDHESRALIASLQI